MKFNKTLLLALSIFAANTTNASEPGPTLISVDGVGYNVYVQRLAAGVSVVTTGIDALVRITPWFGNVTLARSISAATYTQFNSYYPNVGDTGPYAVFEAVYDPDYSERTYDSVAYSLADPDTGVAGDVTYRTIFAGLAGDITGGDKFFLLFNNYVLSGPTAEDTFVTFRPQAFALRNAFNLQSAKIGQGLSYDCTVYDQKNICVSFAGTRSDGKGFDATTGALIFAHKPTQHFRFGGYVDQSFGSDTSGGLTVKRGNPGFGVFGVWTQNADGSGVQVRAAANMGKVDIETQREAIDSAEAGKGQSNIKSQGFSLEVSKNYAINSQWSARPYVGYRKTTNTRAGYTEQSSDDVTAPLTYSQLKQNTETLTAGATFAHALSAKTTMFLTAGLEQDLKSRIDRYAATWDQADAIDSIDMAADKRKTRPTVSFAMSHNIDKTQRVGVSLTHRQEVFESGSTTSAFVQYAKGF